MRDLALNEEFAVWDETAVLPALPVAPRPQPNQWPPQLVFDLALALDPQEAILLRHGVTEFQLACLYENPSFRRELAQVTHELRENNTLFKQKAKVQAETYLEIMDGIMHDDDTPAGVKLSVFQTLVKLAELEPEKKVAENNNQAQVVIRIESNVPPPAIDITPKPAPAHHAS